MSGILGSTTNAAQTVAYTSLQVQTSSYGNAIPVVYGTTRVSMNLIWFGDFVATQKNNGSKGGKSGGTSYDYTAAVAGALCEGQIWGVNTAWQNSTGESIIGVPNTELFVGTYPQTPWTQPPASQQDPYTGIAYFTWSLYGLTSGASLYNQTFEVQGQMIGNSLNGLDAQPDQVITDMLTNPYYGAGFPTGRIGTVNNNSEAHTVATSITVTNSATFNLPLDVEDAYNNPFICVPHGTSPVVANLIRFSQDFEHTQYWTVNSGILAPDSGLAPDGTLTADLITCTVSSGGCNLNTTGINSLTINGSTTYTTTIYAKALGSWSGSAYFEIANFASTHGLRVTFNLFTGATSSPTTFGSGDVLSSYSATSFGSGWWRLKITGIINGGASFFAQQLLGTDVTAGIGTQVQLWGQQVVASGTDPGYEPTFAGYYATDWNGTSGAGTYTFDSQDVGRSIKINYCSVDPILTQYRDFCDASSLWISPAYTQQNAVAQSITDILKNTISEARFSMGVLTPIPRGAQNVSNNLTQVTNAATASGNVLHFAAAPGWLWAGVTVTDLTNSVIPGGTTVVSWTSTTVTISNNVTGGGVVSGDTIQFTVNYVAPTTPVASLTDDDFMRNQGSSGSSATDDPVLLHRMRISDMINDVKLEFLDRSNQYAASNVEQLDMGLIFSFGRRPASSSSAHMFADLTAATVSAQLQLQQQYVLNSYVFTLDPRYAFLDACDLVAITDSYMGLSATTVFITKITENDDGSISVYADEWPVNLGAAAQYSLNAGVGYEPNFQASPGEVNVPVILEPPVTFLAGNPQLMIGLSGSSELWGGADVYVSLASGGPYSFLGTFTGESAMGVTSSSFGGQALTATSGTDTTHVLVADMTESFGNLPAATPSTGQNYLTSCWVCDAIGYTNGEMIGYGYDTVSSTPNIYGLTNTFSGGTFSGTKALYRGQLGTTPAAHAIGSMFLELDLNNVFTTDLPSNYVGVPLYFKFTSFNIYGGGQESLAAATVYSYTPTGSGGGGGLTTPAAPTGPGVGSFLTSSIVTQNDGTIISTIHMTWTASATPNLSGYEVQGRVHGAATWLSQLIGSGQTTYDATPLTPGGFFDLRVRAFVTNGIATLNSAWLEQDNFQSAQQSTVPALPTGQSATADAGGLLQIQIQWNSASASLADVQSYNIYRSPNSTTVNAVLIATIPDSTSGGGGAGGPIGYLDTGLQSGTQYYYSVTCVNTTMLESTLPSPLTVHATTTAVPAPTLTHPNSPSDFTVTIASDGTIKEVMTITWSSPSGNNFTDYEVQWDTTADGFSSPLGDVTIPKGTNTTQSGYVAGGIAYEARVRSVLTTPQGSFFSSWSTSGSVTAPAGNTTAPAAPTGLTATSIVNGAALNWNANTEKDLAFYRLYFNNTSGTFGSATLVRDQIRQNSINTPGNPILPWTFLPNLFWRGPGWFWVTAVNTSGQESSPSSSANCYNITAALHIPNTYGAHSGTGSLIDLTSGGYTYTFEAPAMLTLTLNAVQSYQTLATNSVWGMGIEVDGTIIAAAGNIFSASPAQLSPSCSSTFPVTGVGSHTIKVVWLGQAGPTNEVDLTSASLTLAYVPNI